jgi:YD repeat-containing protein
MPLYFCVFSSLTYCTYRYTGHLTTYVYDAASRQIRLEYSDGMTVTYTYDNAHQRTKMNDAVGVTTYSYDELGRPKAVNYPPGKAITYSY